MRPWSRSWRSAACSSRRWSGRGLAPWLTVTLTTAAFAVFHFEPTRLLVLVVIGAVLGYVRAADRRSLGASIVTHAVNNLPGALGLLLLG